MHDASYKPIAQKVLEELPPLLEKEDVPGASIAFADSEGLIWSRWFGFTDEARETPVTQSTKFSMQSCSKTFTATAVMLAVQDGLLELDAPITAYLPDFTVQSRFEELPERKITLRNLLSHRAGFTHEAPVGGNYGGYNARFEDHIESISATWLRFPVGDRFGYSNLGFDLAGYILQVVSNRSFEEYVAGRLFDALRMSDSTFDMPTSLNTIDRAIGHDGTRTKLPVEIPMMPSGGLYSTAEDIAKFLTFQLGEGTQAGAPVLDTALWKTMCLPRVHTGPDRVGYALGVERTRTGGLLRLGHSGGGFGFLCDMYWWPDLDVGITLLTNSTSHSQQQRYVNAIAERIAETKKVPKVAREKSAEEMPEECEVQAQAVERFVAHYVAGNGEELEIRLEGCKPILNLNRSGKSEKLHFYSQTRAYTQHKARIGLDLRFFLDSNGTVTHVENSNGFRFSYNDSPRDLPGPYSVEWDDYIGEYEILQFGKRRRTSTVHVHNGYLYLDRLKLSPHLPGLFFTPVGEALDFRNVTPTIGNIPLHRVQKDA